MRTGMRAAQIGECPEAGEWVVIVLTTGRPRLAFIFRKTGSPRSARRKHDAVVHRRPPDERPSKPAGARASLSGESGDSAFRQHSQVGRKASIIDFSF